MKKLPKELFENIQPKIHIEIDKQIPKDDIILTIDVPEDVSMFTDQRTKVKTVAFPILFPTTVNGILSITHLDKRPWFPSEDIKSITIHFKPL